MILKLYSQDGVYNLFADNFYFNVKKHLFGKYKYSTQVGGSGYLSSYPSFYFKKKENAEKLKQYIIDNFNNDFPTIDIRKIQQELIKNDD